MAPIVDGVEQQFNGRLAVKRINAAEGEGLAVMRGYRIQGHPTTLVFDQQGQEVQRLIGPQPAGTLEAVVQLLLTE